MKFFPSGLKYNNNAQTWTHGGVMGVDRGLAQEVNWHPSSYQVATALAPPSSLYHSKLVYKMRRKKKRNVLWMRLTSHFQLSIIRKYDVNCLCVSAACGGFFNGAELIHRFPSECKVSINYHRRSDSWFF